MYIVSTAQMQAAEKAADASGLSYDRMMENAGHAVAKTIEAQFDVTGVRVLILVGPGNNGGDGLVVARYLAQMGAIVSVYVWKRNWEQDKNWTLLDATAVERILSSEANSTARLQHLLNNAGIIVDALLGTGVSRPIEGTLADLLDTVKTAVERNRCLRESSLVDPAMPPIVENISPVVVAVDVPSGLNSDTGQVDPHTLTADLTVTLAAVKYGHITMPGPSVVGQLVVGDIGILPEHYPSEPIPRMVTACQVSNILPLRSVSAHKGTFGTALIAAGCNRYPGAGVLAGQSAGHSGAGLVTLAPPRSIQPLMAAQLTEATWLPLPDEDGGLAPAAVAPLQAQAAAADALLLGPGLGQAQATVTFLLDFLRQADDSLPPLVLDADALNILAGQDEWWTLLPPQSILTPHPGEMGRLTGLSVAKIQADRRATAAKMAARWNQIVLLKGAHTVIAHPDGRLMVLPFANPALAKGGSGDVLAGIIVSLLAQGVESFEAAIAGAYMHGLAGELARELFGTVAVTAGDLVDSLPDAFREIMAE